jgi:hypothetical protein
MVSSRSCNSYSTERATRAGSPAARNLSCGSGPASKICNLHPRSPSPILTTASRALPAAAQSPRRATAFHAARAQRSSRAHHGGESAITGRQTDLLPMPGGCAKRRAEFGPFRHLGGHDWGGGARSQRRKIFFRLALRHLRTMAARNRRTRVVHRDWWSPESGRAARHRSLTALILPNEPKSPHLRGSELPLGLAARRRTG